MVEVALVDEQAKSVLGEVGMRVDEGAGFALADELHEHAGEELALALAGEADDVLVAGDILRAKPELQAEQGRSVGSERDAGPGTKGPEGILALVEPSSSATGSRRKG